MAKIPNVSSIKRRNDSGQAAVSSYSPEGMTAGLDEAAKFAEDLRIKRVKSQASKAEADMMVYLENQKTAFDHDDNYETIEKRWNDGITDQFGRIASTIQDAEVKEQFIQKYRPRIEAQRGFMRDLAWGKEMDQDRADILERSRSIQDAFALSGDAEVIEAGKGLFDNSKGFSEEEIVKHKQSFGVGALKARLNAIALDDPYQAIELLNSDVAVNNMPEGERANLLSQYQDKSVDFQAVGLVQDYMDRDLSISAGMAEAESIEDANLRKEVEQRFNYAKRMEKAGEVEVQAKIHEDWHVRIGPKGDGSSIDDIPMEQWELLTPEQRQNLKSLQYDKRTVSDFYVLGELYKRINGAKLNGDWSDFNDFYVKNSSKLSYMDRKEFLKLTLDEQSKGFIPKELDTGMTDYQMIEGVMTDNGLLSGDSTKNKKIKAAIYHKLGLWRIKQQKQGKEPNDEEVIKALDRFILNYNAPIDWWPDSTEPFYKLNDDQIKKNLIEMRDDNPERYQFILDQFAARKERPTEDLLLMLMRDEMSDADVEEWFNE